SMTSPEEPPFILSPEESTIICSPIIPSSGCSTIIPSSEESPFIPSSEESPFIPSPEESTTIYSPIIPLFEGSLTSEFFINPNNINSIPVPYEMQNNSSHNVFYNNYNLFDLQSLAEFPY
ncbi:1558_t:CDS:1, partial [Dentiscutata heterogama]